MKNLYTITSIFAGLLLAGMPTAVAAKHSAAGSTRLLIIAEGSVTREPDFVTFSAGFVNQAYSAKAALEKNNEIMGALIMKLSDHGVSKENIQTSGLSIFVLEKNKFQINRPKLQDGQKINLPFLTSYEVRNRLTVRLDNKEKLSNIIEQLVEAGANEFQGPNYQLHNDNDAYDAARIIALNEAKARAALYAAQMSLQVKRVVAINEGGGANFTAPAAFASAASFNQARSIAPGSKEAGVRLTVEFELSE